MPFLELSLRCRAADESWLEQALNELEERLRGAFVRVSRSDLIAITHVAGIHSNGDGSATLTLRSTATVHVSRRRSAGVRALLDPR